MSSSYQIRRSVRRLKSAQWSLRLERRHGSVLPFLSAVDDVPNLLLDTTVYVDQLQDRLPRGVETLFLTQRFWHSSVTESELSLLIGLLDPRHPDSANATEEIIGSIERRASHRIVTPDRDIWREAGILADVMARLQQYGSSERRRVLNDALIFLSAAKEGLTVLTRNIADYDLLMQLAPHGRALFYEL